MADLMMATVETPQAPCYCRRCCIRRCCHHYYRRFRCRRRRQPRDRLVPPLRPHIRRSGSPATASLRASATVAGSPPIRPKGLPK